MGERADKFLKNSVTSVILQLVALVFAFVSRKIFLSQLSIDYAGVNGLFTNVLTLLSLSELGFASAVTYNLYKPLETNDTRYIKAIMSFFKNIYRIVAAVITVAGTAAAFFLPLFVGDSTLVTNGDYGFLRIVYFLFLFQTVSSYFFIYRITLATADQRTYIFFKVDLILRNLLTVLNLVILFLPLPDKNLKYIVYLLFNIAALLLTNIIKSRMVLKHYPYLREKSEPLTKAEKKIVFTDVKNLFIGQVSTKILTSTDSIVISKFINVATVGLYDNYTHIVNAVMKVVNASVSSMPNTLGSMVASNDENHAYKRLKALTDLMFIFACVTGVFLFALIDKFVLLFFGADYVLGLYIVIAVVLNYFFQIIKEPLWYMIKATGQFARDKYISLLGAFLNIALSIALVIWLPTVGINGLLGVIAGTIISQITQMVLKNRLLFKYYFKKSCFPYTLLLLRGFLAFFVICAAVFAGGSGLDLVIHNAYAQFAVRVLLCIVITPLLLWLFYRKSEGFKYAKDLLSKVLNKFLHKKKIGEKQQ